MNRIQATHLARFLTVIGQSEEPDSVCRFVATTALQPIPTLGVVLYVADRHGGLALVGSHGMPDALLRPYRYVSLNIPLPLCAAFNSSQNLHVTSAAEETEYPVSSGPYRDRMREAWSEWESAILPLTNGGVPFGALLVIFEPFAWHPDHWLVLDGVAAASAMWLQSHGFPESMADAPVGLDSASTLSERQASILGRIREGRTNPEIAESLHVSVSLVKQEIGRVMRLLDCHDRDGAVRRAVELGLLRE